MHLSDTITNDIKGAHWHLLFFPLILNCFVLHKYCKTMWGC